MEISLRIEQNHNKMKNMWKNHGEKVRFVVFCVVKVMKILGDPKPFLKI